MAGRANKLGKGVALLLILWLFLPLANAAPIYSGPDWVDSVPVSPAIETWQTSWSFELFTPAGSSETVLAAGEMNVLRFKPTNNTTIDTDILSIRLLGDSSFGAVRVSQSRSAPPGSGAITKTSSIEADGFFDIYFEFNLNGFLTETLSPLQFLALGMTGYPPDGTTYSSSETVELFTLPGSPSGYSLGGSQFTVSFGEARAVPVPAAMYLFATALIGMIGLAGRRKSV